MSAFDVRPFRPEDLALSGMPESSWYEAPRFGLTAEHEGAVIGYGGVQMLGRDRWAFMWGTDKFRSRPFWLHRLSVRWYDAAEAMGMTPILAQCDDSYPRAAAWLQALRFRPIDDDEKSALLREAEARSGLATWVRG
jgi:hypothetical protein